MDVGVDTNKLNPYSYDEIKRIMNKFDNYPNGLDKHI